MLPKIEPDCALLTNISRDQLDRFGEVDITYNKLMTAGDKRSEDNAYYKL